MRVYRGLASRVLECGCFVGSYETFRGETVEIIDARAPTCIRPEHRLGTRLPPAAGAPGQARADAG